MENNINVNLNEIIAYAISKTVSFYNIKTTEDEIKQLAKEITNNEKFIEIITNMFSVYNT